MVRGVYDIRNRLIKKRIRWCRRWDLIPELVLIPRKLLIPLYAQSAR